MGVVDEEGVLVDIAFRLPLYVIWLIWEITKANVEVARRILDPRLPISPRMVRVKVDQRHELSRVIYANSITLTPGTVSVDIEGDMIIVHALTKRAADEVETGRMGRQVKRLEGSK
jgi:multicomponent Na+:H+ antiporter subunit E